MYLRSQRCHWANSGASAQLDKLLSSFTKQTGQQLNPNQFGQGSGTSNQLDQLFDFVGKQTGQEVPIKVLKHLVDMKLNGGI